MTDRSSNVNFLNILKKYYEMFFKSFTTKYNEKL